MTASALSSYQGLASAARTATASTALAENAGSGLQAVLDVTATPNNSETLTVGVQVYDPVSAKYQTVTTFTALTASGINAAAGSGTATYVFTLKSGGAETVATSNHEVQALPAPRNYRVQVVHSSTGSWTYSLGVAELA